METDSVSYIDETSLTKVPEKTSLYENYPDPFNPSTKIKFALPKSEHVNINVFNMLGQKIETLLNKKMPIGYHILEFTAHNLASGIYFYKIEAGNFEDVKKMLLLK